MQIRAQQKNIKISPRKLRLVADLVRGSELGQAREILLTLTKKGARFVFKTLESAAANARHNHQLSDSALYVSQIVVDGARTLKRWQPVSMGRAHPILKRHSHLKIVLSSRGEVKPKKAGLLSRAKPSKALSKVKPKLSQKLSQPTSVITDKPKIVVKDKAPAIFDPRRQGKHRSKQHLDKIRTRGSGGAKQNIFRRKAV